MNTVLMSSGLFGCVGGDINHDRSYVHDIQLRNHQIKPHLYTCIQFWILRQVHDSRKMTSVQLQMFPGIKRILVKYSNVKVQLSVFNYAPGNEAVCNSVSRACIQASLTLYWRDMNRG
jgi:hypothetical protein